MNQAGGETNRINQITENRIAISFNQFSPAFFSKKLMKPSPSLGQNLCSSEKQSQTDEQEDNNDYYNEISRFRVQLSR